MSNKLQRANGDKEEGSTWLLSNGARIFDHVVVGFSWFTAYSPKLALVARAVALRQFGQRQLWAVSADLLSLETRQLILPLRAHSRPSADVANAMISFELNAQV